MTISSTGDGLNILISCDYLLHHNWMSFLAWYSISKNLPDAKVYVATPRKIMNSDLFSWTYRCKIPLIFHREATQEEQVQIILNHGIQKPLLIVPPDCMCIRDFKEADFDPESIDIMQFNEIINCDCKEDKICVFATYSKGWGNFVTSSWINKATNPFIYSKYNQCNLTVNEARLGRLWESAVPLFKAISRG